MRVAPKPEEIAEIYIDESSQTNHRYLVLGGVGLKLTSAAHLSGLVMEARLPELPKGEAKWTRVSMSKLAAYKRIVDVLFKNIEAIHFHSLVVDTTLLDHRRFNEGNREIGFNKDQLAMKFARPLPIFVPCLSRLPRDNSEARGFANNPQSRMRQKTGLKRVAFPAMSVQGIQGHAAASVGRYSNRRHRISPERPRQGIERCACEG
jgi:hypothetical protein